MTTREEDSLDKAVRRLLRLVDRMVAGVVAVAVLVPAALVLATALKDCAAGPVLHAGASFAPGRDPAGGSFTPAAARHPHADDTHRPQVPTEPQYQGSSD